MQTGSHIRLGEIAGIPVGIHYSWFIIFGMVALSLAQGFFPSVVPNAPVLLYWVLGLGTTLLFFASVLIHELAHSIMARASGLKVDGIDLFVFGGVSKLEDEPQTPFAEFKIAIVGPITSFALAIIFYILAGLAGHKSTPLGCVATQLWWINLVLGAFNLIPGFPLDGGRVLRAILWDSLGSLRQATRIAAMVGQFLGYGLIGFGVILLFGGIGIAALWYAFIGWFLLQAAEAGYQQVVLRESIAGVKVRDVMRSEAVSIPADLTVQDAVDRHFFRYDSTVFPVFSGDRLEGVLTLDSVRALPKDQWSTTSVGEVVQPVVESLAVSPDDELEATLNKIGGREEGVLLVMDDGEIRGVISQRDLLKYINRRLQLGL